MRAALLVLILVLDLVAWAGIILLVRAILRAFPAL